MHVATPDCEQTPRRGPQRLPGWRSRPSLASPWLAILAVRRYAGASVPRGTAAGGVPDFRAPLARSTWNTALHGLRRLRGIHLQVPSVHRAGVARHCSGHTVAREQRHVTSSSVRWPQEAGLDESGSRVTCDCVPRRHGRSCDGREDAAVVAILPGQGARGGSVGPSGRQRDMPTCTWIQRRDRGVQMDSIWQFAVDGRHQNCALSWDDTPHYSSAR